MPFNAGDYELGEAASAAKASDKERNSHREFVRRHVGEQLHG
jgi:hypothetical protein